MAKETTGKAYRMLVTETHQKTVVVRAGSEQEARQRAEDAWKNTEFILGPQSFQGVEFYILGESDDIGSGDRDGIGIAAKDGGRDENQDGNQDGNQGGNRDGNRDGNRGEKDATGPASHHD